MITICNINKFEAKDGNLVAQVEYHGTVYDDVQVVSLLPLQTLPRNNVYGLFMCLGGGNDVVFPLETHLQFLPKSQGEVLCGDIENNTYFQFQDGKVNLQAENTKLLKIIQELMLLILTNFQTMQNALTTLAGGQVVPSQSPAPQPLTVAGTLTGFANNLTTKNNEINDKITTLQGKLIQ